MSGMPGTKGSMRGLTVFISEIRNGKTIQIYHQINFTHAQTYILLCLFKFSLNFILLHTSKFDIECLPASTKEEEESKINKEMAKIRKKFKESGAKLSGYDRRKYVSKILYMYLLGYEPDFGYMEAINLISSSKYAEKQMVITKTWNCSRMSQMRRRD